MNSHARLSDRVAFWARVVLPSLSWGVQTLRAPTAKMASHLSACQNLMFRKMMKLKRRPQGNSIEPWVAWQQRSLAAARDLARKEQIEITHYTSEKRASWAGHLIRLGNQDGTPHVCKYVASWRPLRWWREQQFFNLISHDVLSHPFGWGFPRRWEGSFPANWMADWGSIKK